MSKAREITLGTSLFTLAILVLANGFWLGSTVGGNGAWTWMDYNIAGLSVSIILIGIGLFIGTPHIAEHLYGDEK